MNKVGILCRMDRAMMYEFSERSVNGLRSGLRFRLILPLISDLMGANVDKEVDKDALVIKSAANAFSSGVNEDNMNIADLFRETTEIDKRFVEKLFRLPAAMSAGYECICYESIEDIRKKRIQLLVSAVYEILSRWLYSISFREAARRAYSQREFENLLRDILHLYSLETRELSNSFKLPLAKDLFGEAVFKAMEAVADGMAADFGGKLFVKGKDLCQDRT